MLTATAGKASKSFALRLNAAIPKLSVSASSVAFGNVKVSAAEGKTLNLTSAGTAPVTIYSAALTGAGLAASGVTFPVTLNPGQTTSLGLQFEPVSAGAAAGTLTIVSNSSTGATTLVPITGTAMAASMPNTGVTYYLAPAINGGKDSNNGLSVSTPWLTPKHAVNCGDVILAAASTAYDSANFGPGKWGVVACPSGDDVAWLKCATFDTCKISTNKGYGMSVTASYWGVQGWEITTGPAATYGTCFDVAPNAAAPTEIHHIILANNIANGCQASGLASSNRTATASVDYLAIVGNIAYNAAQSNTNCYSGISVFEPIQSDSLPGTHIYVAGNFSYGNVNPNPCNGATPSDGEGIIFDTFDGSQSGMATPYRAQAVAENNILVANGGRGLEVYSNRVATAPYSSIYFNHNTMWGNNRDLHQSNPACGELVFSVAATSQALQNLAVTNSLTGCGANPIYAYFVSGGKSTDVVDASWGYAASGTNATAASSTGFLIGPNNTFGVDPELANPMAPGAPSCGGYTNVPACMATIIDNFSPLNPAARSYGYQIPSDTPIYNSLFPQWLCNVNLPAGLVSMGCKTAP